jgi:hypothetical protein
MDCGYTGANSTGLSDSIFGTAIWCSRILQASSCTLRKLATDHKTTSCRMMIKPWHVQLRAASSKSGSSLKHAYAQCVLIVSHVNDHVSTGKGTRTQNVTGNITALCQCHAQYTATGAAHRLSEMWSSSVSPVQYCSPQFVALCWGL